ncbi:MAG: alkane 1-monooxygenase [Bacteroidota bacterium]
MKRNYKYAWSLLPAILVLVGNILGGWWVALNAAFVFLFLTLLEFFLPDDVSNEQDSNAWFPDVLLFIHAALQTLCIASLLWTLHANEYSLVQYFLLALSVGANSGASAIVIAHELIHRKNRWYRLVGSYLLFTAGNIYFYVDHLKVHHKHVGTDEDPATARKGETVYGFFKRSIIGQIASAWQVEKHRLTASNRSQFSMSNYLVASLFLFSVLLLAIFFWLGWLGVAVYMLQVFFANFLLEYTNYIEHYGLTRKPNERVTEHHSWQTDKVLSRFFLIDLSRHADHHYYASKPYHTLITYEKGPSLPFGYVSMIYVALIPPLFFKVIHASLSKLGHQ